MANINTSYKNAAAHGTPLFEVMDTYLPGDLFAGAEPAAQPSQRHLLADSLTLAQFTVVGFDSSGKLTPAVYNATVSSGIKPVGVLLHAATSGVSNTTKHGEVLHFGNFNVGDDDAGTGSPLVWHSSFDTLAKKTTWPGLPVYNGNPNLVFRSRTKTTVS